MLGQQMYILPGRSPVPEPAVAKGPGLTLAVLAVAVELADARARGVVQAKAETGQGSELPVQER